MDKLASRYNSLKKLNIRVNETIEYISGYIAKDLIPDTLSNLGPGLPENPFDAFLFIDGIEQKIEKLIQQVNNIKPAQIEASESSKVEFKSAVDAITRSLSTFKKESELVNLEIIPELSEKLTQECIKDESKFTQLRNKFHSSFTGVALYASVLQALIDHYYTANKSKAFELMALVEEDKDLALESFAALKSLKDKSIIKNNPIQCRFGMVPVTASMDLTDLINKITQAESKSSSSKAFSKLAKELSIGIIVFNRVVYNPIEYNIRPLILSEEAAKYLQPKEYGITARTINRFKTILPSGLTKVASTNSSAKKSTDTSLFNWDFSTEIHNPDAEKFYIIETLNGNTYRFMAPWLSSSNLSLTRFRVLHILNYDNTKPTRATNYHCVATKHATKNMFLSKALDINSFDEKSTDINSGTLQHDLLTSILEYVEKYLNKNYPKGVKSSNDILDILHESDLIMYFSRELVRRYKTAAADDTRSFDAGAFDFNELLCSFSVSLQKANRRFAREIHNSYSRNPLKPEVFGKEDSKIAVMLKLREVLQESINLVIKFDENLYTDLNYKYLILNFT